MSNLFVIFTVCALTACSSFSNVIAGRFTQFYSIYEETDCQGDSRNLTKTNYNILSYSSSRQLAGLWKLRATDGRDLISAYPGENGCAAYLDWGRIQVKDVEKLHPFDLDDPALLVSEDDFYNYGLRLLGPESAVAFFSPPIRIQSWVITGLDSYILSSSTGVNATSICLEPSAWMKARGYGLAWGARITPAVQVQMIQRVSSCPSYTKVAPSSNKSGDSIVDLPINDGKNIKPN